MNNPFEALSMDMGGGGSNGNQVETVAEEVDADWLQFVKPHGGVHIRISEPYPEFESLPSECCLLAVSNVWDLAFVGTADSIRIIKLSDIENALVASNGDGSQPVSHLQEIKLAARPVWVRLAMGDRRLVVGTAGSKSVSVYDVKDIVTGKNLSPLHTFPDLSAPLLNLLPNPSLVGGLPHLVLCLAKDSLRILNIGGEGHYGKTLEMNEQFSCVAWSAKGKQFVAGTQEGTLNQYAPDGTLKATIPCPEAISDGNHYPTAVFWLENDLFLVTYNQKASAGEPEPIQEHKQYLVHRRPKANPPVYTFTLLEDILPNFGVTERSANHRHFAHLKNLAPRAKHLGVMSSASAADIAVMMADLGGTDAEPPKWLVLRLEETARASVPTGEETYDEATCLGLDFDLRSEAPVKLPMYGGVQPPDLPPQPRLIEYTSDGVIVVYNVLADGVTTYDGMIKAKDISTASDEPSTPAPATMSSGVQSTTPATPASPSPFSAPAGASKPAFGGVKLPTFGSLGKPSGSPAFGASAFGSSAFGPPASSAAPAFGSLAFGKSSFGTSAPAPSSPSTPSTSATSAFGASAFGKAPSAFGASAFGKPASPNQSTSMNASPSTTSAFGASAFGAPSAFGKPVASAFGTTSQPSAFATPVLGASAFGKPSSTLSTPPTEVSQGSAFGTSAFSKPSAFGQATASGFSFGKPAQSTTSSAFGAPAATSAFGAKSTSGFGLDASAFTSASAAASASKPASSAFGSTTFGKPKPAVEFPQVAPTTSPKAADSFGFNDFEDMLGASSKQPESPPTEPASPSSPTSPPAPPPATDNSAYSFIKPSKAASAFGNIAQTAAPTAQPPATAATPHSAFGSSAFGKPSGFGSTAFGQPPATTSGFGASTFGKPSPTTSTFGKPAVTTAPQEASPISGGFGGFAGANKGSAGGLSFGLAKPSECTAASAFAAPAAPQPDKQTSGDDGATAKEAEAKSTETSNAAKESATQEPTTAKPAAALSASSPTKLSAASSVAPLPSPPSASQPPRPTVELEKPAYGPAATAEDASRPATEESAEVSADFADDEKKVEDTAHQPDDKVSLEDAGEKHSESVEEDFGEEAEAEPEREEETEFEEEEDEYPDEEELHSEHELHEDEDEDETQEDVLGEEGKREPEALPTDPAVSTKPTPVGGLSFGKATSSQSDASSIDAAVPAKGTTIGGFSFGQPTSTQPPAVPPTSAVPPALVNPFAAASPSPTVPNSSAASPSPPIAKPGKVSTLGFRQPSTAPIRSSPLALPSSLPPATPAVPKIPQGPQLDLYSKVADSSIQQSGPAFPTSVPQKIAAPSTPATFQSKRPVNIASAQTPMRGPTPQKPAVVPEPSRGSGLAVQYFSIYRSMVFDLKDLSVTAHKVAEYHAEVGYKPIEKPTREDLKLAEFWYFGVLEAFLEETNSLEGEVKKLKDDGVKLYDHVRKVLATMSKANTKSEDCFRYMRTSRDPEFAKRLRSRQLGPEQAENQQKLRAMSRATMERIEHLEAYVARCKKRVSQERTGRVPLRPSALEHATRTIRNIDQGVRERQDDLRELAKRLKRVSVTPRPSNEDLSALGLRSLEGSGPVFDMSAAALSAEVSGKEMKDTFLAAKRAPLRSTASGESSSGAPLIRPVVVKTAVRRPEKSISATSLAPTAASSITALLSTPNQTQTTTPSGGFFGIAPVMSGLQHAGRAPSRNAPTTKTHVQAPKASQPPLTNGQAAMSPPKSAPNLFFAQSYAQFKPAEPRPPTFTGFAFPKK